MAHEVVQEHRGLGSERHLAPRQGHPPRGPLQEQLTGHEPGGGGQRLGHATGAAQHRADPGGELSRVEGLGQVVVGTVVEG